MFSFEVPGRCSSLPWLDTWLSLKTVVGDKDLAVNAALPSPGCALCATLVHLLMPLGSFEKSKMNLDE